MIAFRERSSLYFRNNWGIKTNISYWLYLQYCRLFSKKFFFSTKEKVFAKEAWKEGCAKLGVIDTFDLSKKVFNKFELIELNNGHASLSRSDIIELAEPIYQAVSQIQSFIFAYYKSFFKINWIDIQKIAPGMQPKGSSFSYHIDDSPYSIAKIFIYLTDTYEANGAFRAFNYEWTDKFLRLGLLKSSQPGKIRNDCQRIISEQDEKALKIIEGRCGSAFIFDNNLAHKGTLPVKGCRVHIVMEIMPCIEALSIDNILKACSKIPSENYNPKPYSKMV